MVQYTIVITYDDNGCGPAAQMLYDTVSHDATIANAGHEVSIKAMEVVSTGSASEANKEGAATSHRDFIFRTLQDLYNVPHEHLYVVSFLRNANHEEYNRVMELCGKAAPPVACKVVSHVGNYQDIGLLVRNLVRRISSFIVPPKQE